VNFNRLLQVLSLKNKYKLRRVTIAHTSRITIKNNYLKYNSVELELYEKDSTNSPTTEEFNEEKPIQGSIIYGHNGSGKSSIARALRDFSNSKKDQKNYAELNNRNYNDSNNEYLFVYDEKFKKLNIDFATQNSLDDSLVSTSSTENHSELGDKGSDSTKGLDAIVRARCYCNGK